MMNPLTVLEFIPELLDTVTVAVVELRETEAVVLLATVTLLPLVKATSSPSRMNVNQSGNIIT